MLLQEFIITVYCCIDDQLKREFSANHYRTHGFAPKLSDSEVLTMEIVGEFLGIDQDKHIWSYFSRHWKNWFPNLGHRTTFTRQAANLWQIKQIIQRNMAREIGAFDDSSHIIDGFPIPVCLFARARRKSCFKGIAGYGRCPSKKNVYFGFKGHLVITLSGIISQFELTPANVEEHQVAEEVTSNIKGLVIGDKGFISKDLKKRLKEREVDLQTPLKKNMKDNRSPTFVFYLKCLRRKIETVISQLTGRFHIAKVWAHDAWHAVSRISRKLLAHTIGVFLNKKLGRPIIQFEGLIT
jgi:hypothetical protein